MDSALTASTNDTLEALMEVPPFVVQPLQMELSGHRPQSYDARGTGFCLPPEARAPQEARARVPVGYLKGRARHLPRGGAYKVYHRLGDAPRRRPEAWRIRADPGYALLGRSPEIA